MRAAAGAAMRSTAAATMRAGTATTRMTATSAGMIVMLLRQGRCCGQQRKSRDRYKQCFLHVFLRSRSGNLVSAVAAYDAAQARGCAACDVNH